MDNKQELIFDTLILGGGPAGFSAGMYAARGAISTAIIDISMTGGQPSNYLEIENYPGFPIIDGFELMQRFEEHAEKFGVVKFEMQEIKNIDLVSKIKTVETEDTIFKSKTIIIATGAQAKKLGIEGEKEFVGRGVSYCAVCDAAFYKGKTVAVVGGGNAAVEEAHYLTKFADKVYVIHRRDTLRADKIVQQRAFNNPKLEFIYDTIVEKIEGSETVQAIAIKNLKNNLQSSLKVDGIFPYIGFTPNVDLINSQIAQNESGFIITDENMRTSISGVWAVGDVRNTPLRQVITAAADGAIAACDTVKYLEALKEKITV